MGATGQTNTQPRIDFSVQKEGVMRIILSTVAGALTLMIVQGLVGTLWPPAAPPPPSGALPWAAAANVVMALTLSLLASGARWRGWRLAAALFVIAFSIGSLSAFIEAVFFDVIPLADVATYVPMLTLPLLACVLAVIAALGHWRTAARTSAALPLPSAVFLISRGAVVAVVYTFCYFLAGMLVYPYIRDYYASKALPSMVAVAAMQLFVRGPLFAAVLTLLTRMLPGSRRRHAVVSAAAMAVFLGVIPLIVPNAILPDAVRWAHFVEVVSSNFVFGAVAGWLMNAPHAILPGPAPTGAPREEIVHGSAH
jgi:hypothetical protein